MPLEEYVKLPRLARIRVAHEEALLTGSAPKDVFNWLEKASAHIAIKQEVAEIYHAKGA